MAINGMDAERQMDGTYDKNAMMCAHRTLSFGTMVRVVNRKNGKHVDVKVTDRGPFGKGLIIDLSTAAAKAIGMLSDGVATVDLYLLPSLHEMEEEAERMKRLEHDHQYLHIFDTDSIKHVMAPFTVNSEE